MKNLKAETIWAINGRKIAFAEISVGNTLIVLPPNHNKDNEEFFLNELDLEYNNEDLFTCGYIAFTDGTWIARKEYDKKQWWENYAYPTYTNPI